VAKYNYKKNENQSKTMKIKKAAPILITFLIILFSWNSFAQKNYNITFRIKGMNDSLVYMVYYYGNKFLVFDTISAKSKGTYIYQGEKIPGGIYMIVGQDKSKYFEFIMNEAEFKLFTDTSDIAGNMKVVNSQENQVFYEHLIFMNDQYQEINKYNNKIKELEQEEKEEEIKEYKEKISELYEKSDAYREGIIQSYPDLFFSKLLKARIEPKPREKTESETDSAYGYFVYNYYQNHFFDNIDFSDRRMLRTPVLEGLIDKFMEKVTIRHPDSLKYAAKRVIDLAYEGGDSLVFKYVLIKLFNEYVQSKYMGMDAVALYIAEHFYLNGKAYWADSTQMQKIWEWAYKLSSNLIGMKAKPLVMKDINDKLISMYDIKTDFSALIFWDHTCGHCKTTVKEMRKLYDAYDHEKNLEVYCVYIGHELDDWKEYLKEHDLEVWINVSDPNNYSDYRINYNVYSSPMVYLLDKNKNIIAKKISIESLEEIINSMGAKPISDAETEDNTADKKSKKKNKQE
jgi:hypothetical protein